MFIFRSGVFYVFINILHVKSEYRDVCDGYHQEVYLPSGSPPAPASAGRPPSAAAASSASPPSETEPPSPGSTEAPTLHRIMEKTTRQT